LRQVNCQHLYLVGDIVDFWRLKYGLYWPRLHNEIVRRVLEMARQGTRVTYIPGNHDELLRDYAGSLINGIAIEMRTLHETADGRRFLVLHGDEFDGVVCSSRWLAKLGSGAYEVLLILNRWFNYLRRKLGAPYWSLSAYLKHKVKNAVSFIFDFEQVLIHAAQQEGVEGVICGHIHHAALHQLGPITYGNCGDWVESCTALVEDHAGALSILRWTDESLFLLDKNARPEREVVVLAAEAHAP
jgi:UDP-2,3-diacylglucosamine pyrophosphatase LpxH